jgi:hypothetical protein
MSPWLTVLSVALAAAGPALQPSELSRSIDIVA